ncbi:MAG: CinA family protein [Candidatus Adiutrix sp.]|jgi:PncC family amidohydrolase|nr:CinA family protein [Candidatus Adiutrix sp.]
MISQLSARLAEKLTAETLSVATAESCTGGRVAAALTSTPGSSVYFQGGVVAYSNQLKVELLGVPMEVILSQGAVSRECALAMAEGVRRKLGVKAAVASTGIAGPDGGSREKPVGLVWLAAVGPRGACCVKKQFSGDREAVTRGATLEALALLMSAI